jgi:hypothetical protein
VEICMCADWLVFICKTNGFIFVLPENIYLSLRSSKQSNKNKNKNKTKTFKNQLTHMFGDTDYYQNNIRGGCMMFLKSKMKTNPR